MRIAIVNDLPITVEVLRRTLAAGGHQVAWVAFDGADAVERCAADRPDLVLMDLIMPVMDGVQATAAIMRRSPCAILIVTATVSGNAAKVFDAMGYGALDAVSTPVLALPGEMAVANPLLEKIALIGRLLGSGGRASALPKDQMSGRTSGLPWLVVLAASTGGPAALAAILSAIPHRADTSIGIVQHLDLHFSEGLAGWLNEQSRFPVVLAREGSSIQPGVAFVAATNDHLVLAGDLTLRYTREPVDNPYRPSVDVFFGSLRRHWPLRGVAALLTGMGNDGAEGLLSLRQAGWRTIAQDQNSSIIYGMPAAAARLGAAAEILPLPQIAPAIVRQLTAESHAYAGQ